MSDGMPCASSVVVAAVVGEPRTMNNATLTTQLVVHPSLPRRIGIRFVAVMLAIESATALAAAVAISGVAQGAAGETGLRFLAGAAIVAAVGAYVAARAVLRERAWSYATAAVLQIGVALGVSALAQATGWHAVHLGAVGIAAAIMLGLSLPSVRTTLGQG